MADEDPQNPIQASQRRPGSTIEGLSSALMQGAFEKFGQAFTDTGDRRGGRTASSGEGMDAWRQAGARTAQAMADRWHQMEYKTFENEHLKPYADAKRQLLQQYQDANAMLDDGMWPGPDGTPQPLNVKTAEGRAMAYRKRSEITTRFFNQSADQDMNLANEGAKYDNNPIIAQRVLGIVQTATGMLQNVAQPPDLEAQATRSEMEYRDRMATTEEERTKDNKAAIAAQKEAKEPRDISQALASPMVGPQGILQWMTAGGGREILLGDAGAPFINAAREEARQSLLAGGNFVDDGPEGPETAKLNAELDRIGPDLLNIAAVNMLRQHDPQAADAAKVYSPQFFSWEKTADQTQPKPGILGDKRRSKRQLIEQIDIWKPAVDAQLQRVMEDPRASTDPEAAISAIIDQWLPAAMVGEQPDSGVPSQFIYAKTQATAEERRNLAEQLRNYLRTNWAKNPLAAEINPIEAAKQHRGPSGLRGRRQAIRRAKSKGILSEE